MPCAPQRSTWPSIAPGEIVLDVGCGTGAVAMAMRRRLGTSGRVYGIDPAPQMIAVARRKAKRARLAIDYQVAGVEALPFPDDTFDVVTSSLMMHHLPADLQRTGLKEMYRVLKPGGRLLVVDFKPESEHGGRRPLPLRVHRHRHDGPHGHISRTVPQPCFRAPVSSKLKPAPWTFHSSVSLADGYQTRKFSAARPRHHATLTGPGLPPLRPSRVLRPRQTGSR